ncbi:hypothetical protein ABI59_15135 [Acidobacteria bacterium Mor1]|nr:hypothetical protein ABI59_15135 [Acidobacteria bacterium Mor1]
MPTSPDHSIDNVAGAALHYAREPIARYGSRGEARSFFMTRPFAAKLTDCFAELWQLCPLGRAEVVTSAGAFVHKPGYHGLGRAFDIDGIFWEGRDFVTLDYPARPRIYLAIEAVLRRHFGTVLNYLYNSAHQDHLHIDDGTPVDFYPESESRVLFVQASLTHLLEEPVQIDGRWGPQTSAAVGRALTAMGSRGRLTSQRTWLKFLGECAGRGFASLTPVAPDPLDLLQRLYNVAEHHLVDAESKKQIETAISAFAEHPETAEWLAQFQE